ncbi:E3 ubiquitin-protein ligase RNF25 [Boleophthalmus pectinirostris]|uniref:E3 ubiquitin-protein ligase RNF25 n=1 Tax=Boleophthalmus pectinirostris TaxID=150288 RepID=UPI00242D5566|nr:E3 ubiquitin-protein ligase RNF25 [Boleophthalmus pectinirostris]
MAGECDVASEIEVLQSIYLDELQVERTDDGGWEVRLVLHPSTAQDSVSQFVRLTLTLTLDQKYPLSSPSISIHNPRGLSDDKINSVQKCLQAEAQSSVGSPVLYQLIEKAKEILTESNIPHGNCVICLYDFKEGETLTKTCCYHYFHSHCLGRYVQHSEHELEQRQRELQEDKTRDDAQKQELNVVCPVCRESLNYDVSQLLSCPAPLLPEVDEAVISSAEFQLKWSELQKILEKQKTNGGIIDPEEESNRFLIHIQAPAASENPDLDPSLDLPSPPNPDPITGTDPSLPSMHQCRDPHNPRRHSHGRGQRHGGRQRPITDQLDHLSLCSNETKHSKHTTNTRLLKEDYNHATPPDATMEAPKSDLERGHRGRRRGPHHHYHHPAPMRHHWEGRGSIGRGGHPHSQCYRGGKSQRRGPPNRPVDRERTREEVL